METLLLLLLAAAMPAMAAGLAKPSADQIAFQFLELGVFIHYGIDHSIAMEGARDAPLRRVPCRFPVGL